MGFPPLSTELPECPSAAAGTLPAPLAGPVLPCADAPQSPQQPRTLSCLPSSCFSGDGGSALKLGLPGCQAEATEGRAGRWGSRAVPPETLRTSSPGSSPSSDPVLGPGVIVPSLCLKVYSLEASEWASCFFLSKKGVGHPETPRLPWELPVLRGPCGAAERRPGRAQAAAERAPARQGRARGGVCALNLLTQGSWRERGCFPILPAAPGPPHIARAPSAPFPPRPAEGAPAPRTRRAQRREGRRSAGKVTKSRGKVTKSRGRTARAGKSQPAATSSARGALAAHAQRCPS